MSPPRIVLASTSRYRAALLRRLLANFEQIAPAVDEPELAGEAPATRAMRLACRKAQAVAIRESNALVIGSDQVAALGNAVLHKPGTLDNARQQLRASNGNRVDFYTGLCVIDTRSAHTASELDHTCVVFRELTDAEIARYVAAEQPLDCAGSFKAEGAGIALFERIDSVDPTALIGLPLIALGRLLRGFGVVLP